MNKNIKLLLISSILIHSGVNLLAPVYAIYLQKIDGTLLETGVAVGIYTILKGVLCLIFSKIKPSKISYRKMMIIGYTIMGGAYLLYSISFNISHVFFLQAVIAIGESLITPSWSAVIAVSLTEGKEREIYSNFYGYRSIFEGLAAIVGGLIAMKLGFFLIFITMAIFAFISSLLVSFISTETKATSPAK